MKAATGELNLTVITIIAIGVVIAFFTAVLWPQISRKITESWDDGTDYSGRGIGSDTRNTGMILPASGFEFTYGDYVVTSK